MEPTGNNIYRVSEDKTYLDAKINLFLKGHNYTTQYNFSLIIQEMWSSSEKFFFQNNKKKAK